MILLKKLSLLIDQLSPLASHAGRAIKQFLSAAIRVVTVYQGSASGQSRTFAQVKATEKEKLKKHFCIGFSPRVIK